MFLPLLQLITSVSVLFSVLGVVPPQPELESASSLIVDAPSPHASAVIGRDFAQIPAGDSPQVEMVFERDRLLKIRGDLLYPYDPGPKEVDLVIFWPGLGYGTSRMILEHEEHGVVPALAQAGIMPGEPSDVMVLLVRDPKQEWSKVAKTIGKLEDEHQISVRRRVLACWSGGVIGAATSLSAPGRFEAFYLADPSPASEARHALSKEDRVADVGEIQMWHYDQNWGSAASRGGFYREGIQKFSAQIRGLGGEVQEVQRSHRELLLLGLSTAIRTARDADDLSLYDETLSLPHSSG